MDESNDFANKNRSSSSSSEISSGSSSSSSSSSDGSGVDRLASLPLNQPDNLADEESDLGFDLFDEYSDEASSHSSTITPSQRQDDDDVDGLEPRETSGSSEWVPFLLACQSADVINSGRLDVANVQKIFFRLAPIVSDDEKKGRWRDMDQDLANLDTYMIDYSDLQEYLSINY